MRSSLSLDVAGWVLATLLAVCGLDREAFARPALTRTRAPAAVDFDIDPSYGVNGSSLVSFAPLYTTMLRMLPTGDGGYWALGTIDDVRRILAIARLLPDGSLDPSFGLFGTKVVEAGISSIHDVTTDGGSHFYAIGDYDSGAGLFTLSSFGVQCFDSTWEPCAAFGNVGGGVAALDFIQNSGTSTYYSERGTYCADTDALYLVGSVDDGTLGAANLDLAIAAFDAATGLALATFGDGTGRAIINLDFVPNGPDLPTGLACSEHPDQSVLYVIGSSQTGLDSREVSGLAVAVDEHTGGLVAEFGDGGVVTVDFDLDPLLPADIFQRVLVVRDGLIIEGRSWSVGPESPKLTLTKLDSTGSRVTSFGRDGKTTVDGGSAIWLNGLTSVGTEQDLVMVGGWEVNGGTRAFALEVDHTGRYVRAHVDSTMVPLLGSILESVDADSSGRITVGGSFTGQLATSRFLPIDLIFVGQFE